MSTKYIQTISLERLLKLEREYYEQRERYRDYNTSDGRYWYRHWGGQLHMVTVELHRRAA